MCPANEGYIYQRNNNPSKIWVRYRKLLFLENESQYLSIWKECWKTRSRIVASSEAHSGISSWKFEPTSRASFASIQLVKVVLEFCIQPYSPKVLRSEYPLETENICVWNKKLRRIRGSIISTDYQLILISWRTVQYLASLLNFWKIFIVDILRP